jgi:hypothetical protein
VKELVVASIVLLNGTYSSHEDYEFRKYTLNEMSRMTEDKIEIEYVEFTEEQMVKLRAGECLSCDMNAQDPNLRPDAFKNF